MSFPTPLLDQLQAQKRQEYEQERLVILVKTQQWLTEHAPRYGIYQAYLVGSLTRPYQFTHRSDVDLAVEQINPDLFFLAVAELSEYLERDVDIINLAQCSFRERLRQGGIPWTVAS